MLSITSLVEELKEITAWQRTPVDLTDGEYINMIVYGIKTLFIDTSRAASYDPDKLIVIDREEPGALVSPGLYYDQDFLIDEERYILLTAQISFFQKVQSDVNNIVGYTTDALSVTNADKPYAHLQDTIRDLKNERRIVYYKMVRYNLAAL